MSVSQCINHYFSFSQFQADSDSHMNINKQYTVLKSGKWEMINLGLERIIIEKKQKTNEKLNDYNLDNNTYI